MSLLLLCLHANEDTSLLRKDDEDSQTVSASCSQLDSQSISSRGLRREIIVQLIEESRGIRWRDEKRDSRAE